MNQAPPPLPPHYERLGRQLTAAAADLAGARAAQRSGCATVGRRLSPRAARLAIVPGLAIAIAAIAALLPSGGHDGAPTSAFAAPLVRFAHASPRVLIQLPGWHVVAADDQGAPRGEPAGDDGALYLTHSPTTSHSRAEGVANGVSHPDRRGLANHVAQLTWSTPTVRERAFVLDGHAHVSTGLGVPARRIAVSAHGRGWLDLSAYVIDDHQLLQLRATVTDMSVFRSELSALRTVDATTWLQAMPPNVITALLIAVVNRSARISTNGSATATNPTATNPTATNPTGTNPTHTNPTSTR